MRYQCNRLLSGEGGSFIAGITLASSCDAGYLNLVGSNDENHRAKLCLQAVRTSDDQQETNPLHL
jgi:hypothetical protein